jgi:hypothetical protein
MMQFFVAGLSRSGTNQSQTMMICVTAQKNHAARHHLIGVDVGNFEAENLRIESRRFFQIANL